MKQPLHCTECGYAILQLQWSWSTAYFMNRTNWIRPPCTIPTRSVTYVAISWILLSDSSIALEFGWTFNFDSDLPPAVTLIAMIFFSLLVFLQIPPIVFLESQKALKLSVGQRLAKDLRNCCLVFLDRVRNWLDYSWLLQLRKLDEGVKASNFYYTVWIAVVDLNRAKQAKTYSFSYLLDHCKRIEFVWVQEEAGIWLINKGFRWLPWISISWRKCRAIFSCMSYPIITNMYRRNTSLGGKPHGDLHVIYKLMMIMLKIKRSDIN